MYMKVISLWNFNFPDFSGLKFFNENLTSVSRSPYVHPTITGFKGVKNILKSC